MIVQKAEIIFCIVETKGAERDWGYKPIANITKANCTCQLATELFISS
jgi:hypothetical protein